MWDRITEKRNEGGFTLIELLIVIIILAILAAIVVFAVGTTGQNAKNAACNADAKTFETALEDFKAEVGYYPGGTSSTTTGTANNGALLTTVVPGPGTSQFGPFMRELPGTAHYSIWTDGIGGVFVFPAGVTTLAQATTYGFSTASSSSYDYDTASTNPCGNPAIVS
jgi:prepilin-type N-terminal cleavage/methylation domain-containing protein